MAYEKGKQAAAMKALEFVEDGMVLGLGTGSTAELFIHALAEKLKAEAWRITGVSSSVRTAELAKQLGIPLTKEVPAAIDIALDGADEADNELRLIKGGGGALWREKIVAAAAKQVIIMADESKLVSQLGQFPLPVEVLPFAIRPVEVFLSGLLGQSRPQLRHNGKGKPFRTDSGNVIFDCPFEAIANPESLAAKLDAHPAVVCHGLFLDYANKVIIGKKDGRVKILRGNTNE